MGSNQCIHVTRNGIGNRHGHGVVCAVVDKSVRFERTNGHNYGLDLCWNEPLEFLPIQVIHGPGGRLLGVGAEWNSQSQEKSEFTSHSESSSRSRPDSISRIVCPQAVRFRNPPFSKGLRLASLGFMAPLAIRRKPLAWQHCIFYN